MKSAIVIVALAAEVCGKFDSAYGISNWEWGAIMKTVKIAIAVITLTWGSPSLAENLVYYGETGSGSVLFYDEETIRRNGNIVLVWNYVDASKDNTKEYRTSRNRFKFDCDNEEWDLTSWATYDKNGTVLKTNSSGGTGMEPIIPGTVITSLFKIVCSR